MVGVGHTNGSVETTFASEAFGSEPDIVITVGFRARLPVVERWSTSHNEVTSLLLFTPRVTQHLEFAYLNAKELAPKDVHDPKRRAKSKPAVASH